MTRLIPGILWIQAVQSSWEEDRDSTMCNSFGEVWKSQDEKQHKIKAACLSAALSAVFSNC